MQIHLALSELPDWYGDERLGRTAIVHVTPGLDGVSRAVNEAERGLLPAEATIVCGQPMAVDPSRAPDGSWIVWIQLQELPAGRVKGDAAGEIDVGDGTWTEELREAYADRITARLGRHIQNLERATLKRVVLSPADIAALNVNLVGRRHLRRLVRARPELPLPPAPAGARAPHGRRQPLAHRRLDASRPRPRRRLRLPRLQGADEGAAPAARLLVAKVAGCCKPVKLSLSRDLDGERLVRGGRRRLRGGRLRRDRDLGDEAAGRRRGERRAPARARPRRRELRPDRAVDPPAPHSRDGRTAEAARARRRALREHAPPRRVRAGVRPRPHRAGRRLELA